MEAAVERLLEEDEFSVYVPGTETTGLGILVKADGNITQDIEEARPIGGYCSTETLDRQNEVVVAKGLDFSEFVQWGYYNDNHRQETSAVLGYPRLAKLDGDRWYTEGNLLKGYTLADKVWELAKALRKSNAPRRLGFSIEGKVKERGQGNRIVRAVVRNVAITNVPVNTDCTWDILTKAFASPEAVAHAADKALAAGHGMRQSGGSALRQESLEAVKTELARGGDLSFEEAVERVHRLRPHLTKSTCVRVVRWAMCH